jgi:hypothetical protein
MYLEGTKKDPRVDPKVGPKVGPRGLVSLSDGAHERLDRIAFYADQPGAKANCLDPGALRRTRSSSRFPMGPRVPTVTSWVERAPGPLYRRPGWR